MATNFFIKVPKWTFDLFRFPKSYPRPTVNNVIPDDINYAIPNDILFLIFSFTLYDKQCQLKTASKEFKNPLNSLDYIKLQIQCHQKKMYVQICIF